MVIIGAGGWAREVSALTKIYDFYVDDGYEGGKSLSTIPDYCSVIIAIADPLIRFKMFEKLKHKHIKYLSYIHKTCVIYSDNVVLSDDCFLAPYCVLTDNIKIGKQVQLNIRTFIGHDCVIGDFFTTSPHVVVAGDCIIGDRVHVGSGAVIREKISVCDDVKIGQGCVVVKDITESGIYVGNPARKI